MPPSPGAVKLLGRVGVVDFSRRAGEVELELTREYLHPKAGNLSLTDAVVDSDRAGAQIIQAARLKAGLTQAELAERLGS